MRHNAQNNNLFSNPLINKGDNGLLKILKSVLSFFLGIPFAIQINKKLNQNFKQSLKDLLNERNIKVEFCETHLLEKLDLEGPIVVTINHPHGVMDAIVTAHFIEENIHPNWKAFANKVLKGVICFPDEYLIPADNQGKDTQEKINSNLQALTLSNEQLNRNGILVYAPAGEVSFYQNLNGEQIIKDASWFNTPFKLAKRTGAQILPLHISGKNSEFFYFIRKCGRTPGRMFLFWEFIRTRNKTIQVTVKEPVNYEEVKSYKTKELTEKVYNSIYKNNEDDL